MASMSFVTTSKLGFTVSGLEKSIDVLKEENYQSHDRLWRSRGEHDKRLLDHETRLLLMEKSKT